MKATSCWVAIAIGVASCSPARRQPVDVTRPSLTTTTTVSAPTPAVKVSSSPPPIAPTAPADVPVLGSIGTPVSTGGITADVLGVTFTNCPQGGGFGAGVPAPGDTILVARVRLTNNAPGDPIDVNDWSATWDGNGFGQTQFAYGCASGEDDQELAQGHTATYAVEIEMPGTATHIALNFRGLGIPPGRPLISVPIGR